MVWDSYPPLSANPRGRELVIAMWCEFGVTAIVMALRLYTRAIVVYKVLWDDFWMASAFFTNLVAFIFNNFAVNNGFGMHADELNSYYAMEAVKWADIAQVLGIMASLFARLSYIVTLMNLLGPFQKIHRWILRILFAMNTGINCTIALYILLQCRPLAGLWNKSIDAYCLSPHIQQDIGFSQSATNAFTDFCLALMPATIFWKLNIKRSLKVSLIISMSLGIFACVTAIIKTVTLTEIGKSPGDESYEMWGLQFWYSLENCTIIVAATIPVLRPLFRRKRKHNSTIFKQSGDGSGFLWSVHSRQSGQQSDRSWHNWFNRLSRRTEGSNNLENVRSTEGRRHSDSGSDMTTETDRPASQAPTEVPPSEAPLEKVSSGEESPGEPTAPNSWPERGILRTVDYSVSHGNI